MNIDVNENNIPLQIIEEDFFKAKNIKLYILREDLIHPEISGNKWRKLKYNIKEAKTKGLDSVVTFGGAFSNHIAATAAAGKYYGLNSIGIIRGENVRNPTLDLAIENGMQLSFVSRENYKLKDASKFSNSYVVPEGGSNALAVKGCTEIVNNIVVEFDMICCACGTGGTIAGIIESVDESKQVVGFPALKGGEFLKEEIEGLMTAYEVEFKVEKKHKNWSLNTDYHFGGYAKVKPDLVDFVQKFKKEHNIELDLIYTGKMLFGLYDMIQSSNQFGNKTIVVVHTGGVQGNLGFKKRFGIEI
jgi:1-aminocyclopropane-1-carboxylate deaminase/D-cysteine desulfhydrase-like pyridoxal-dependent ACC family enzyme